MELQEKIRRIAENNSLKYNKLKAVEELNELSAALLQSVNKKNQNKDDDIIEEMGDVLFRLMVLEKHLDSRRISKRIEQKVDKSIEYLKKNKYKNV